MGRVRSVWLRSYWVLCLPVLAFLFVPPCPAQGNQQIPSNYPAVSRGVQPERLNILPSNPLGLPGSSEVPERSSDSILLSNALLQGVLPQIPNLQVGYLYTWANQRQGRLILDYTLPLKINRDVAFVEVHSRFEDLIKTLRGNPLPNVQMLLGGGYRYRVNYDLMLGVNGFYNTTRLHGQWRSSGIAGLEMCVLMPGDGMIDMNFNYYGNVFSGDTGIFAAFSRGRGDFKFEAAYSQPLLEKSLIMRLKASHYIFHKLGNVRGYYVGSDFRTADGMYRLEYVHGQDAISGRYNNLGFYVSMGFRLEKVFSGRNPFSKP